MTGQSVFFVGSGSLELMNLPPNLSNHTDDGIPFAESLVNQNPPPNHSHNSSNMLSTMNLLSSPPSHHDSPPFSQPCLCFGEPCFPHIWSRDLDRGPSDEGDCRPFGETTGLGEWGGFGNVGSAVLGLSFGNNDIYDGRGLGYASGLLTDLGDWHHDLEPDDVGEQWNVEAEVQDAPLQPGYQTNIDDFVSKASQGIDTPNTTIQSTLHYRVKKYGEDACHECSLPFPHTSALDTHAKQTQHAPYACNCGSAFARFDILDRHLRTFNPQKFKFYPCQYCSKHSGQGAFKRPDHLMQHLRGYHNHEILAESPDHPQPLDASCKSKKSALFLCPHKDCLCHKDGFGAQKDFTKHLREVHDESLYPCDVSGCSRINGRGFFRKRDLMKHQKGHLDEDSDPALQVS